MILFITPKSPSLILKVEDNSSKNQDIYKELWQQTLEKSHLYSALSKFDIVSSYQKFNSGLKESISNKMSLELLNQPIDSNTNSQSLINDNKSTDSAQISKSKISKDFNFYANEGVRFRAQDLTFSNLNFYSRLTTMPKVIQVNSLTKPALNSVEWLDKNVVATLINSNLEIWIRDVGLRGVKLSDVLINLRQSMAELGANLSKVTINGKVAFHRKK